MGAGEGQKARNFGRSGGGGAGQGVQSSVSGVAGPAEGPAEGGSGVWPEQVWLEEVWPVLAHLAQSSIGLKRFGLACSGHYQKFSLSLPTEKLLSLPTTNLSRSTNKNFLFLHKKTSLSAQKNLSLYKKNLSTLQGNSSWYDGDAGNDFWSISAIFFTVTTWDPESNCTCREKDHFLFH